MDQQKKHSEPIDGFSFTLATANFKGYALDMGTPVRISNGMPKFKLPVTLKYKIPLLFPRWEWVQDQNLSVRDFRAKYWRGLDAIGLDNIGDVLQAISDDSGGKPLVLLCYERMPRDCHRGDFAMWWKDRTGVSIPELTH